MERKGKHPQRVDQILRSFPPSKNALRGSINNSISFLMKVTEKTGVIIVMEDPHISRLAAINLRGRLNALSPFYTLEKLVKDKDKKTKLGEALKKEEKVW